MPFQLVLLTLPSIIYLVINRRRGQEWPDIRENLGWQGSPARYYLWAVGIVLLLQVLGWAAMRLVPPEVLEHPNVSVSAYAGREPSLTTFLLILLQEAVYIALGEEIFFRGFLGGWLYRRLGFAVGNLIQSAIFLLPHLLLLAVSLSLWRLVLVQWLAGWFMGWLRYRSDSILPGWLAHTLTNTTSAMLTLL